MGITNSTHAHFKSSRSDWDVVRQMMTGENAAASLRRRFFEHDELYKERRQDSDHTPWTHYLMARLAGMIFERSSDVERELGPAVTDADLESAGPDDEDYSVQLMEMMKTALAYNTAYVCLNPRRGLEIATPLDVPNWTEGERVITGSRVMPGQSVFSDVRAVDTWTRYTPVGYEVYRKATKEDAQKEDVLIESGIWAENDDFGFADGEDLPTPAVADQRGVPYFVDGAGMPSPPVVRVELPWSAKLGVLIARKHRGLFRLRSRRDFHLSTAINGRLQIGAGGDIDLLDKIKNSLKKGGKVIPYNKDFGEHKGLSVPIEGAKLATKVMQAKKEALMEVAYNSLEQAARQSATEAMIKHQGGAAAALSVAAETLADAEVRILRLWNQMNDLTLAGPNSTPIDVSASWPADYSDITGEDLVDRLFPQRGIPVDTETATSVVVSFLEDAGYSPDEAQIRDAVEDRLGRDSQERNATQSFLGG